MAESPDERRARESREVKAEKERRGRIETKKDDAEHRDHMSRSMRRRLGR